MHIAMINTDKLTLHLEKTNTSLRESQEHNLLELKEIEYTEPSLQDL